MSGNALQRRRCLICRKPLAIGVDLRVVSCGEECRLELIRRAKRRYKRKKFPNRTGWATCRICGAEFAKTCNKKCCSPKCAAAFKLHQQQNNELLRERMRRYLKDYHRRNRAAILVKNKERWRAKAALKPKIKTVCRFCQKTVVARSGRQITCASPKCKNALIRENYRKRHPLRKKKCVVCETEFDPITKLSGRQMCCGRECSKLYMRVYHRTYSREHREQCRENKRRHESKPEVIAKIKQKRKEWWAKHKDDPLRKAKSSVQHKQWRRKRKARKLELGVAEITVKLQEKLANPS
jgi:hypothetical protein